MATDSDEQAAMAYSCGEWGEAFTGKPQFRANYEAGKAAFKAHGGQPDLFHSWTSAWES